MWSGSICRVYRNDDGILFARDGDNTSPYTDETVWFSTGSLTPRPEAACMYPVGTSGLLNSSTNLAPLISVTLRELMTTIISYILR